MNLPPRSNGSPLTIDTARRRQIVIIGANGAGKTRFADYLAAECATPFHISALKALYERDRESAEPQSIDALYHEATRLSPLIRTDIRGEFDRLIALLINEAVADVVARKYGVTAADDHNAPRQIQMRLDRLIDMWQKIYPDNKILIEQGKMLIGHTADKDINYSALRLSDGERATMYYLGAAMYAPQGCTVFVDAPGLFLHQSVIRSLWDCIEALRPDCTFVYTTHDLAFASTRATATVVWVRSCDPEAGTWAYDIQPHNESLPDDIFMAILGARKPVLFIEGDGINSIDAKLYPLIFPDFTMKSLGSCDRVIEATRSFNAARSFHNLDAYGIVDRDRREEPEVRYLRGRQILVPNVAEIENIFLLEDVIKAVASHHGRDPQKAFAQVRRAIFHIFEPQLRRQALQHTRHHLKKEAAHRIDGRFNDIGELERHVRDLARDLDPRATYQRYCSQFRRYIADGDYASVLSVFNHKPMLADCHAAGACGLRRDDKDSYISEILAILRQDTPGADAIRTAVRACFGINQYPFTATSRC